MGFGASGLGPSGFFGLGLPKSPYKHKRINLGKNGANIYSPDHRHGNLDDMADLVFQSAC